MAEHVKGDLVTVKLTQIGGSRYFNFDCDIRAFLGAGPDDLLTMEFKEGKHGKYLAVYKK